jgi:hypothetical protein
MPLPNVERIDAAVTSPTDRPPPGGFGIVSRDWSPRLRFAGTYDQAWIDERMPLLPDDFDMRYNQSVPDDQWIARPVGGEAFVISGMTPNRPLHFALPRGAVRVDLRYRARTVPLVPPLDCVLVDCDARRVELTWRGSADVHGDPFQLETIAVACDSSELAPSSTHARAS